MPMDAPRLTSDEEPFPATLRFLEPDGKVCRALPGFARDAKVLIPLYRAMVLTRAFDQKAVSLQRTGRLGTFASSLGQEAVGVGVASAMRTDDVLLPTYRDQSAMLWRGVKPVELLTYWGGDERGNDFSGPRRDFPISIPVASQIPHAAGVALAMKLKGEQRAAVGIVGDGGTSKGDFYEAINIAGVWRVPAVFIVNNNQWAISVPLSRQTAALNLAQKGMAAGIPGEQVDGNDVVAVRDAAERALARARAGEGPSLIEAVTYRLSDHTTADDAHRYRSDADVSRHWKEEPVVRLKAFLVRAEVWSKPDEEALLAECAASVERAVAEYLSRAREPAASMFDHLFAQLPKGIESQRAEAARYAEARRG